MSRGENNGACTFIPSRRLGCRLLILLAFSGCGSAPPPPYAEGVVSTKGGSVTITTDSREIQCREAGDRATSLTGFKVGAFFEDGQCRLVHPVNARWDSFLSSQKPTIQALGTGDESSLTLAFDAYEVPPSVAAPGNVDWEWSALQRRAHTELRFSEPPDPQTLAFLDEVTERNDRIAKAFESLTDDAVDTRVAAQVLYLDLVDMGRSIETSFHTIPDPYTDLAADIQAEIIKELESPIFREAAYEGGFRENPSYYKGVGKTSEGVLVVKRRGRRSASAFLLDRQWALTCRHVVEGFSKEELILELDYEQDGLGDDISSKIDCTVTKVESNGDFSLDVAALRIECPIPVDDRVLTFADEWPTAGELVYVIGHPSGNYQKVADRARVRFPHRVSKPIRDKMMEQVSDPWKRDFADSYVDKGDGYFYYFVSGKKFDYLPKEISLPDFGFDSDTEPGFSGGAVVRALRHDVIGLFFGTVKNSNVRDKYGWDRHEHAIPSKALLEWLRAKEIPVKGSGV